MRENNAQTISLLQIKYSKLLYSEQITIWKGNKNKYEQRK